MKLWIDKDGVVDIVPDHKMLFVEWLMQGGSEVGMAGKERKWRLRDRRWENFQVDLSEMR